ncbi:MAG TPA: hypothetical protein VFN20_00725 [Candidatus Acidoferrum sp.]|nr:hypothetical protein [Candidatus Acidoferrum sp.]
MRTPWVLGFGYLPMFALVIGSLFLLVGGFRALNFDLDSPGRRVAI